MNALNRLVVRVVAPLALVTLIVAVGCDSADPTAIPDSGLSPDVGIDSRQQPDGSADSAASSPDAQLQPDSAPTVKAPKAVYTLSNDSADNQILVYARAADGTLTEIGGTSTGGKGSGKGLGSQGALVFDAAHSRFFAVNAGDNSISMLLLQDDGALKLESRVDSGGVSPRSISARGGVVYVANAGDASTPSNISGFRATGNALVPIANSTRALSADDAGPGQIEFSRDGTLLIVSEKKTSHISAFPIKAGVVGDAIVHPSVGMTPFGFASSAAGQLIVSEAFGGMDNKGAASSYSVSKLRGTLTAVSGAVASGQSAPCWVVVAGNYAYVTNTKSNTVAAYAIASDGTLTYTWSAPSGDGPIDAAATNANDLLYVLNARDDSISIYGVNSANGALSQKPTFSGLPTSAAGLVVGSKAVYTMSNASTGNKIFAYLRGVDGSLAALGSYDTGGSGRGKGLGSQGALVRDAAQKRLFAVNAGDNTISMMALQSDGSLQLESKVSSSGVAPISITVHKNIVYVVNAGDGSTAGNIAGFQIVGKSLVPLPESKLPLSGGDVGPAQIELVDGGKLLLVTEKKTNKIDVYSVDSAGVASGPVVHTSKGMTPFGFAVTKGGKVIVSEAAGGMDNLGTASSYTVGALGSLGPISRSVGSGQSAPCWVAIAGKFAYVTNTKTNNLSAYEIATDGTIKLSWNAAAGDGPIDADASDDDGFLYVLNARDDTLSIYAIDSSNGLLTQKPSFTGLPASAVGLVAR